MKKLKDTIKKSLHPKYPEHPNFRSEFITIKNLHDIKKTPYSNPLKKHPNFTKSLDYEAAEAIYEIGLLADKFINFNIEGTKVIELHFNGSQIKKIPESVGRLTTLKKLSFYSPQLEEIPTSIGNLKKLKSLSISSENEISQIPDTTCGLTSLEELKLEKIQIRVLPECIGNLTSLKYLTLSNNQLTELPSSIGNLTKLKILKVNNNKLKLLPDSIGNFKSLIKMNLSQNHLTTLPDSIGNLESLVDLYLAHNKIEKLPNSISNLISLRQLFLSENQLVEIPKMIGKLSSLYGLYLDGNKLQKLPASIGDLVGLKYFPINNNELIELPKSIGKLKNLTTLRINYNNLKTLPDTIGDLENLEYLILNNNKIEKIPESIGELKELRILNLENNELTSIPSCLGNLDYIYELNLKNNNKLSIEYNKLFQGFDSDLTKLLIYLRSKYDKKEKNLLLVGKEINLSEIKEINLLIDSIIEYLQKHRGLLENDIINNLINELENKFKDYSSSKKSPLLSEFILLIDRLRIYVEDPKWVLKIIARKVQNLQFTISPDLFGYIESEILLYREILHTFRDCKYLRDSLENKLYPIIPNFVTQEEMKALEINFKKLDYPLNLIGQMNILGHIIELNLRGTPRLKSKLEKLPNFLNLLDLSEFKFLKVLNLNQNDSLKIIPESIKTLDNLEVIRISQTEIKTLPSFLNKMKSLKQLDLGIRFIGDRELLKKFLEPIKNKKLEINIYHKLGFSTLNLAMDEIFSEKS